LIVGGPGKPPTNNLPLVVVAYEAADPSCRQMWRDPDSLNTLLLLSPPGISFLFLSYSGAALPVPVAAGAELRC
jgi:hypothetical protein